MRFFLVVLLALNGALLFAQSSTAQKADWQVLTTLQPGQQIKVSLHAGGTREGVLQNVSDSSLTLNNGPILKQDIQRVWVKGKGHRVKHTLIGAAIGAGVGLGLGEAIDNDCSPNSIVCSGNRGKAIGIPLFAAIGAGIGAALPAHSWQEIYRNK